MGQLWESQGQKIVNFLKTQTLLGCPRSKCFNHTVGMLLVNIWHMKLLTNPKQTGYVAMPRFNGSAVLWHGRSLLETCMEERQGRTEGLGVGRYRGGWGQAVAY